MRTVQDVTREIENIKTAEKNLRILLQTDEGTYEALAKAWGFEGNMLGTVNTCLKALNNRKKELERAEVNLPIDR